MENINEIIGLVIGVYELIVRAFPTVRDYSVISWIIKFLAWLNEQLNNRKK